MWEILPQLLVNSLITGSVYALVSAGLVLTFAVLRVLNFAHGHLMMLGAYALLLFHTDLKLNLFLAVVCSSVLMMTVGFLVLKVFISPFVRTNSLLPLVTTITLGTILESVVAMIFGVNVRCLNQLSDIVSFDWGGVYVTPIELIIIGSAFLILTILGYVIHRTKLGRCFRAIAEHPEAAAGLGISAQTVTLIAFLTSMLLAGYAGALIGHQSHLVPTMGATYSMKAFAAMVLGGLGNVWGAVAGAYILGIVENLAVGVEVGGYSIPAGYKDGFAFMLILVILLIKPSGVFGTTERKT